MHRVRKIVLCDVLAWWYNKYKKAKRSLEVIDEQIKNTENEIVYYNCLLDQLKIAKNVDISEIFEELNIKKTNIIKRKKQVPNITVYEDKLGNRIYVGKNNIQNNYLTHSFAKSNDIFFIPRYQLKGRRHFLYGRFRPPRTYYQRSAWRPRSWWYSALSGRLLAGY